MKRVVLCAAALTAIAVPSAAQQWDVPFVCDRGVERLTFTVDPANRQVIGDPQWRTYIFDDAVVGWLAGWDGKTHRHIFQFDRTTQRLTEGPVSGEGRAWQCYRRRRGDVIAK